jgi:hypothetical protein
MASTSPRRLEWLWHGWAPRKSLGILMGDPKLGKSQFLLDLAARISRGDVMPDGSKGALFGVPSRVLIVSTEDLRDEVIRPRLQALGANMDNILAITVEPPPDQPDGVSELPKFPADLGRFEATLAEYQPVFVILDAGDAVIDAEKVVMTDVLKPRLVYDPLYRIAVRRNTTIVLNRHENKDKRGRELDRNQGAMAVSGTIRFAWEVIPAGHFIDATADPPKKLERSRVKAWASNWGKLPDKPLCFAKDAVFLDILYEGEDNPETVETAKIQYVECPQGKKAAATNGDLDEEEKKIVAALEKVGKYQAIKTVEKSTGLSNATLRRRLPVLVKKGLVEANNKKPIAYRLIARKEGAI